MAIGRGKEKGGRQGGTVRQLVAGGWDSGWWVAGEIRLGEVR